MIDELNISVPQAIISICVLIPILIKLWRFKSPYKPTKSTKTTSNDMQQLNPDYGAYIQLAGRRYN